MDENVQLVDIYKELLHLNNKIYYVKSEIASAKEEFRQELNTRISSTKEELKQEMQILKDVCKSWQSENRTNRDNLFCPTGALTRFGQTRTNSRTKKVVPVCSSFVWLFEKAPF